MSLGPAHAPTKSEVAYQALLRAIRTGELAPGQRVILATLADQLQMSQTPVRDALSLLADQGLVIRRPNHATIIGGQTGERSSEVSMLRAMLEPEAAMLAAVRHDPAEVAAALEPRAPGRFTAHAVSRAVSSNRSNGPQLLEPEDPANLRGVVDPMTGEILGPRT